MADKQVLYVLAGKSISCGRAGIKGEGEAVVVGKHISEDAAAAFLKNKTLGESAPDLRSKAKIVAEREAKKRESRNTQAVSFESEKAAEEKAAAEKAAADKAAEEKAAAEKAAADKAAEEKKSSASAGATKK